MTNKSNTQAAYHQAWNEGYSARKAGQSFLDCPYIDTWQRRQWLAGFAAYARINKGEA